MSVIVSGPHRLYVIMIFWQRLAARCGSCPELLDDAAGALGGPGSAAAGARRRMCRLLVGVGLQRVVRRRLIGFRFLVLQP